jgi:hypothetical protein
LIAHELECWKIFVRLGVSRIHNKCNKTQQAE